MDASLESLLLALDSNIGMSVRPNRMWRPTARVLERQEETRRRRIQKRRSAILDGSRKPRSPIEKRIRDLRKLVPSSRSAGLDGLFRDAVDYISFLRVQVETMRVLLRVLSNGEDVSGSDD